MTAQRQRDDVAAEPEAAGMPPGTPGEAGLRLRMRGLCSACRQVFGMPDYERYLAHAARQHPGAAVLTRGEFCAREIERKHGRGGVRCC
jgi:uncharacterized short protein YbdD (DUF466 family)